MNRFTEELRREEVHRRRFSSIVRQIPFFGHLGAKFKTNKYFCSLLRKVKDRERLYQEYEATCIWLDRHYREEKLVTNAENEFIKYFCRNFKIQLYPQVWIGNLCVDFFTPALGVILPDNLKGYAAKGLAIEVDGPIHNFEQKMKKDRHKEQYLEDLNIQLWRISNYEVFRKKNLPNRTNVFQSFRKLCSRERARIWDRIYLLTLLYHAPEQTIFELLNISTKEIKRRGAR